jgi:hypothetical protein
MHVSRCVRLCSILLAATFFAPFVRAEIRFVDSALKTGADDGTSWTAAFRGSGGLRRALDLAGPGDQVWVARGTYLPTRTSDRTKSFEIGDQVSVYGGFAGGETALWQRGPETNETILSGDLAEDDALGNVAENSLHVVSIGRGLLDGFTVTGGNANVQTGDVDGAGIRIYGGPSMVRNCTVRGNRCDSEGGGLFVYGWGLVEDCRFEDNVAGARGGAAHADDATDTEFRRCTFTRNQAPRGSAVSFRVSDNFLFRDCLFHGNIAPVEGTIYVPDPYSSYISILGCTIASNTGGGLEADPNPRVHVRNSILWATGGSYGFSVDYAYCCTESLVAGTGNISADPQFVDPLGANFRLAPTSPCVDSGSYLYSEGGYDLERTARREDVPSAPDSGISVPAVDMGAFEMPAGLFTLACAGDDRLPRSCPCGNFGSQGAGCANTNTSSQGAFLEASGTASPDTVVMRASGVPYLVSCMLLQGSAISSSGFVFGDGVRCIAGTFKRISLKLASGFAVVFPESSELSISARSAALGDPIAPGTRRHYQVWYRDPNPGFCPLPTGGTTNVSSAITVYW